MAAAWGGGKDSERYSFTAGSASPNAGMMMRFVVSTKAITLTGYGIKLSGCRVQMRGSGRSSNFFVRISLSNEVSSIAQQLLPE